MSRAGFQFASTIVPGASLGRIPPPRESNGSNDILQLLLLMEQLRNQRSEQDVNQQLAEARITELEESRRFREQQSAESRESKASQIIRERLPLKEEEFRSRLRKVEEERFREPFKKGARNISKHFNDLERSIASGDVEDLLDTLRSSKFQSDVFGTVLQDVESGNEARALGSVNTLRRNLDKLSRLENEEVQGLATDLLESLKKSKASRFFLGGPGSDPVVEFETRIAKRSRPVEERGIRELRSRGVELQSSAVAPSNQTLRSLLTAPIPLMSEEDIREGLGESPLLESKPAPVTTSQDPLDVFGLEPVPPLDKPVLEGVSDILGGVVSDVGEAVGKVTLRDLRDLQLDQGDFLERIAIQSSQRRPEARSMTELVEELFTLQPPPGFQRRAEHLKKFPQAFGSFPAPDPAPEPRSMTELVGKIFSLPPLERKEEPKNIQDFVRLIEAGSDPEDILRGI